MNDILSISDDKAFYTLEGEGRFVGQPSVFLRLAMCNLTCKGFASEDSPHGCDSYISWSIKNRFSYEDLNKYFSDNGFVEKLKEGAILKLTGGEPFLQQKRLYEWVVQFKKTFGFRETYLGDEPILKIDFETNGTILPDDKWSSVLNATFTTSPKMSNNGDEEKLRYKPEVLKYLISKNACFKFVINNQSDLDELYTKYILSTDVLLPKDLIWLMPCCGSRKEHELKAPMVAELCKEHGFNFSPRLHLILWNQALRV
jgi:6-pyruvoyltetrahydropterin 2'-reductase